MTDVIIYNQGGQQELGRVSLRHAIGMLHRKVARVLEAVEGETFAGYQRPRSVELLTWVYTKWVYARTGRVPYTKDALLRRDRYKCAYCGRRADTMDHVIPKSRPGGSTTWSNAVAACAPCNHRKANRTPEEAGMKLRFQPYIPTFEDIYPKSKRR